MCGFLIAFEGHNFAGKSTVIRSLIETYKFLKFKTYKFPNRDSKLTGEIIDKYLKKDYVFNSFQERIKTFAENRLEQKNNILQDLNNGYCVLVDRYFYSGIVYSLLEYNKYNSEKINLFENQTEYDKKKLYEIINEIKYLDLALPTPDIIFLIKSNDLVRNEDELFQKIDRDDINHLYQLVFKNMNTDYKVINNTNANINDITKLVYNDVNKLIHNNNQFLN